MATQVPFILQSSGTAKNNEVGANFDYLCSVINSMGTGSGTVNTGTQYALAYYASNGTAVSPLPGLVGSRALMTNANRLPISSPVTSAELGTLSGVTSAIQTQLDSKAADNLVVHLAGTEIITGNKEFNSNPQFDSYYDMVGIANPAAPAANFVRIFANTDATHGHTRPSYLDDDGNVIVLARDSFIIVKNTTVSTIVKGATVYVNGSSGNIPTIALAKADSTTTLPSIGLVMADILANGFGYVQSAGILSNYNTAGFSSGDQLYVSATAAGGLTKTRPVSPLYVQRMGTVLVSHASAGSIDVVTAPFVGGLESGTTANYTFAGTINSPLTASRAMVTGASGLLTVATTTSTEIGYVNGVTSAIQTQLNNKFDTASFTDAAVTGKLLTGYSSGAGTVVATDTILQGINKLNGNTALKMPLAGGTFSGDVTFAAGKHIILTDNTTGTVTLALPAAVTSYTLTLPTTDGNANEFLQTNGSGVTTWAAPAGSGTVNSGTAGQVAYYATSTTAVSTTGAFTVGANGPNGITVGTNTNDAASAGQVGEYIESVISNVANFPTSDQFGDLTSITLSAGDWDVSFTCTMNVPAITISEYYIGISTTSGNSGTGLVFGSNYTAMNGVSFAAAALVPLVIPPYRMSLSGSTIVYAKYRAKYNNAAPQARGRISARRVR